MILYSYLENNSIKGTVKQVSQEGERLITEYFNQIDEVAYNVAYSNWLQRPLISQEIPSQTMIDEIKYNMSCLSFLYSEIRFTVIMVNGLQIIGNGIADYDYQFCIEDQPWYDRMLKEKKYVVWGDAQPYKKDGQNSCITIFYTFNNYQNLDMIGYLGVRIPLENIEKALSSLPVGRCCLELRIGDTKIAYPKEMSDAGTDELDEKPAILRGTQICENKKNIKVHNQKMELYTIYDFGSRQGEMSVIWIVLAFFLIFIAAILSVVAVLVSRYLTQPILKCKSAMLEIRNNHLGITLQNNYQDEIGDLIDGFNKMSKSISNLIEVNKNISIMQKEAEFKILERQLSPHFLFNSLELINGLILNGKKEDAVQICENLGQLYQYNLRHEKWISFNDEFLYTLRYLEVMSYKMGHLEIDYHVDEEILNTLVIKAILQPVVENSIRHGFRERKQECCISLMAEKKENRIFISIMDNGSGIAVSQMDKLNLEMDEIRKAPEQKLHESSHIGLKNVYQRLCLEYGDKVEFRVISREGLGTRIEFTIPERRADV